MMVTIRSECQRNRESVITAKVLGSHLLSGPFGWVGYPAGW